MDDINFCPACGKNLEPGAVFCPGCGKHLNGPEAERSGTAGAEKEGSSRIRTAMVLLLVNAAVLFLFGIVMFVAIGMAPEMIDMYPDIFSGYTAESLKDFIRQVGVALISGGLICIAAAFLTYKRRLWMVVLIMCIIATVIGITTIVCALIGAIALYYLYKAKPAFTD